MISLFWFKLGQGTSTQVPGSIASVVTHSPLSLRVELVRSGAQCGYCCELAEKCTIWIPAGAVLVPWLQTGITSLPHGTPTARSKPSQLGSVCPGSQGTHSPCSFTGLPHVASHTDSTRSAHVCDQVCAGIPDET